MSFLPNFAVAFRLNREYWPVDLYAVRWPATVLLNGIAKKLVAAMLPVLVVRKTYSKSTKPPGVNSAAPMRNESGEAAGLVSCGDAAASDAGCMVRGAALVLSVAFTTRGS